jgi:hypothetical protein
MEIEQWAMGNGQWAMEDLPTTVGSFAPPGTASGRVGAVVVFASLGGLIGPGEDRDELVDFSEERLGLLRLDEAAPVQVLEPELAFVHFLEDGPYLGREFRM